MTEKPDDSPRGDLQPAPLHALALFHAGTLFNPTFETRLLTKLSFTDLLGWAEAAIFVAACAVTIIYVCARLLVAAVRCGSGARSVALVAGALVFLFVWGFLIFAAFVGTTMAVVSDAQASPAGNESWRHLTVLGVSAAVMVVTGFVACWWARRISKAAVARRAPPSVASP